MSCQRNNVANYEKKKSTSTLTWQPGKVNLVAVVTSLRKKKMMRVLVSKTIVPVTANKTHSALTNNAISALLHRT